MGAREHVREQKLGPAVWQIPEGRKGLFLFKLLPKKKKNTVIKTLIMPSCDYPGKTVLKSRAAIFFHHKLKTFKVIAIINCRILIDQKKFF